MRIENAPSVFPDVADAKFSIGDQTMVAAQEAGDLIVLLLVKHRFFEHRFSLIQLLRGLTGPGHKKALPQQGMRTSPIVLVNFKRQKAKEL